MSGSWAAQYEMAKLICWRWPNNQGREGDLEELRKYGDCSNPHCWILWTADYRKGRGWLPERTLPTFICGLVILALAQKGEDGVGVITELSSFPMHSTRSSEGRRLSLPQTYNADAQIGESSACATALLCGVKTNFETVGLDSRGKFENCFSSLASRVPSVFDWAQQEVWQRSQEVGRCAMCPAGQEVVRLGGSEVCGVSCRLGGSEVCGVSCSPGGSEVCGVSCRLGGQEVVRFAAYPAVQEVVRLGGSEVCGVSCSPGGSEVCGVSCRLGGSEVCGVFCRVGGSEVCGVSCRPGGNEVCGVSCRLGGSEVCGVSCRPGGSDMCGVSCRPGGQEVMRCACVLQARRPGGSEVCGVSCRPGGSVVCGVFCRVGGSEVCGVSCRPGGSEVCGVSCRLGGSEVCGVSCRPGGSEVCGVSCRLGGSEVCGVSCRPGGSEEVVRCAVCLAGKATGVVTTTRITHATPAALYGHAPSRYWEDDSKMPPAARKTCKDLTRQLVEDDPGRNINMCRRQRADPSMAADVGVEVWTMILVVLSRMCRSGD
ncbi:hypothetical protein PR048_005146 [Dryococelus australis]|uniref:alkaline phosphatase n=1 Tax=Dryococelus australis TaxID=614101 RepID=A0ABQ9I7E6_9NEOP|nr:hypothetical protein PR048_005146 [Dryococelus australis]